MPRKIDIEASKCDGFCRPRIGDLNESVHPSYLYGDET